MSEELKAIKKSSPVKVPSKRNTQLFYTGLLLFLSFILGMLWQKVQYLEKNTLNTQPLAAAQNVVTQKPPQTRPQVQQPKQKVSVDVGHLPIKGSQDAKITIVAFEDFRCPFCDKFFSETMPALQKEYIDTGKVKFYYRHFQFLGPASVIAGNASECANEQSKFWGFHDYLYQNQPSESDTSMYTTDNMTSIASQLGLDSDQFRNCLEAKKFDQNVQDDLTAGRKAGVTGTPGFFIDGILVDGAQPYTIFKTIIDQELKSK